MEAFSLLKYWRGGGGAFSNGGGGAADGGANLRNTTTTTIVTAVTHHSAEETDDDDGPFFDLEFAVQDEAEAEAEDEEENEVTENDEKNDEGQNDGVGSEDESTDEEEEQEEEQEFNFTVSSNSAGNDRSDPNLTLSPSDDLFFKGKLVPIENSSLVFNSAEPNSKPQFPISLLKSATKFRVSMLGFKKSKQNASEKTEQNNISTATTTTTASATVTDVADNSTPPKQQQRPESEKEKQSKFFTVKFKVEEVPIMSLFTRDNNNSSRKSQKQQNVEDSEEKKFAKDVMQKYLKKVKPLYVRVSKRYGEKLKFSGQLKLSSVTKSVTLTAAGSQKSNEKSLSPLPESEVGGESFVQVKSTQKQVNHHIPERLKVACKHLGKSRSASSAVAAAPAGAVVNSRRDDSLLQQQDGIQSAILHCKRSFNASRESSESSLLAR